MPHKIVIAPDSFKGTMSSIEVCDIIKTAIQHINPSAEIITIPIADGGEGTVDCFLSRGGGKEVHVEVNNPFFEKMESRYAVINDNRTAIIEMAACAGLPLAENRQNPAVTTTFGVGELIKHAISTGVRELVIGLGGSCTNDAGCGCAAALGVTFYNRDGKSFVPTGATLQDICTIDAKSRLPELEHCSLRIMCDIDNPLHGKTGAAYIFGPQKGADEKMVMLLDNQLKAFDKKIQEHFQLNLQEQPGAGAAGGMGGGLLALLGGKLEMGIETVLDVVGFNQIIEGADLIITGEGRLDDQSLRGKVVVGVAKRAKIKKVPVIAIVGDVGLDDEKIYETGVTAVFSINRVAAAFQEARLRCRSDLRQTIHDIMRLIDIFGYGNA